MAGCGGGGGAGGEPKRSERRITDANQRSVVVPARPERVAALSEPTLDGLLALGVKPVATTAGRGQSDISTYMAEQAAGIPSVGALGRPHLERLASLEPDLILLDGTSTQDDALVDKLGRIAPTVYVSRTGENWRTAFSSLAGVLGLKARGEARLADFDARVADIKRRLAANAGANGQRGAVVGDRAARDALAGARGQPRPQAARADPARGPAPARPRPQRPGEPGEPRPARRRLAVLRLARRGRLRPRHDPGQRGRRRPASSPSRSPRSRARSARCGPTASAAWCPSTARRGRAPAACWPSTSSSTTSSARSPRAPAGDRPAAGAEVAAPGGGRRRRASPRSAPTRRRRRSRRSGPRSRSAARRWSSRSTAIPTTAS